MKRNCVTAALCAAILIAPGASASADEASIFLAHPGIADAVTIRDDSGNSYRLHGIKPPNARRRCFDDDARLVACTELSRAMLQRFTASVLTCKATQKTGDQLTVSCRDFMGRDVGRRMVAAGWAEPDRTGAQDYIFEALEAKARRLGIWRVLKTAER